jgi:hypothetical protein
MNYVERERFVLEAQLIRIELSKITDKIKKMEEQIIQEMFSQVSTEDFYSPDSDTEEPPMKRMKREK